MIDKSFFFDTKMFVMILDKHSHLDKNDIIDGGYLVEIDTFDQKG